MQQSRFSTSCQSKQKLYTRGAIKSLLLSESLTQTEDRITYLILFVSLHIRQKNVGLMQCYCPQCGHMSKLHLYMFVGTFWLYCFNSTELDIPRKGAVAWNCTCKCLEPSQNPQSWPHGPGLCRSGGNSELQCPWKKRTMFTYMGFSRTQ